MNKIGLQLYTVRNSMNDSDSIRQTLDAVKKAGYDEVQLYGSLELSEETGTIAKDIGLDVLGTTGSFDEFIENPQKTIEVHKKLGAEEIGIGGYSYSNTEEVYDFIAKANEFADFAYKNGFKFSYHNHSHEFIRYDNGKTAFEMLVEGLNPETTSFVLDTYWVQHGGGDVRYWIEKLKGRINILHLKDMKRGAEKSEFAEIGNGNLYWQGIIDAAKNSAVRHYVVEQDFSEDPMESIKISSEYLHRNFFE